MADASIPGAINVAAADLTNDMIVGLGTVGPMSAQTTLENLADFFAGATEGSLAITPLTTVGAGSITAPAIAGGITTRSGSQSNTAFTDTTVGADAIIAALPDAQIGDGFLYRYVNNTNATATLAGGLGVTLSGAVAANCTATFFGKYTAASTIVFTIIGKTPPSTVSGTVTANGATPVPVTDSNVTGNSVIVVTLKTVHTAALGAFVSSVTPGAGFSIASLATDVSLYNYTIIN